jgi:UDP-glucose 4-epimerase
VKVVIVGSEGFIGRELLKKCLDRGIEVVTIDSAPSNHPNHREIDVRSEDIAAAIPQGADALINLAAISRDQDCRGNPKLAFDVNVLGTLNLINTAREREVKQFIFASTEWVYGETNGTSRQTEEQVIDSAKIQSEYALSKIVGEQTLRLAQQNGFCPVTILRFGIVYGPRPANWSAVESLFDAVRTKEEVAVGSLATARRFIHVSDVAKGICSVIGRTENEVFNLSGDNLITLQDIITQSSQLLERWPEVRETNPSGVSIRNPDNSKARSVLGWAPDMSLSDGLMTLMESPDGKASAETVRS